MISHGPRLARHALERTRQGQRSTASSEACTNLALKCASLTTGFDTPPQQSKESVAFVSVCNKLKTKQSKQRSILYPLKVDKLERSRVQSCSERNCSVGCSTAVGLPALNHNGIN